MHAHLIPKGLKQNCQQSVLSRAYRLYEKRAWNFHKILIVAKNNSSKLWPFSLPFYLGECFSLVGGSLLLLSWF